MERSHDRRASLAAVALALLPLASLLSSGGCAPLLATSMYVIQGGNVVPAEYDGLNEQRVVVVCRPPSSHEYRHAGASRAISQRVSRLLVENVKEIDVVDPREVDNWIDETDWADFKELARAVRADKVVYIEMNDFELYKGKTLYQGQADIGVTIYDMTDNGKLAWEEHLGEILYPAQSAIPAQDKLPQQFEREFVNVVATRIAEYFYKHDPNGSFALDALANR